MNSYHIYIILILCTTILPIQGEERRRTRIHSNENTGGRMLQLISKVMEGKKSKPPIELKSVTRDTLSYVKQRMLLFFEQLDKHIFPKEIWHLTKRLEQVPSKEIGLTLQIQELKSNWGLPFTKNHIPLYQEKTLKALERMKAAFFQVLKKYHTKLWEHKNRQELKIIDDFDVSENENYCAREFINERYILNNEVYKLTGDLEERKMNWQLSELDELKYFAQKFGQPRPKEVQGVANWGKGMRLLDASDSEATLSSSGMDFNESDIQTDDLIDSDDDIDNGDNLGSLENHNNEENVKQCEEELEEDKISEDEEEEEEEKESEHIVEKKEEPPKSKPDTNSETFVNLRNELQQTILAIEQDPTQRACLRAPRPEITSLNSQGIPPTTPAIPHHTTAEGFVHQPTHEGQRGQEGFPERDLPDAPPLTAASQGSMNGNRGEEHYAGVPTSAKPLFETQAPTCPRKSDNIPASSSKLAEPVAPTSYPSSSSHSKDLSTSQPRYGTQQGQSGDLSAGKHIETHISARVSIQHTPQTEGE